MFDDMYPVLRNAALAVVLIGFLIGVAVGALVF